MKGICSAGNVGLARELWFPASKPFSDSWFLSWKGLAALWGGKKHGVRSLESWIQILAWLPPLNVALGMAQTLPGPLSCLPGGASQSPCTDWRWQAIRGGRCSIQPCALHTKVLPVWALAANLPG